MYKFLMVAFFAFRIYLWINKNKSKNENEQYDSEPKAKKPKSKRLDDILGDFIKDLESKHNPQKPIPVHVNSDTHKAEVDSDNKLDWQQVNTTQIIEKKQLLDHNDYKNISHHNQNVVNVETENIEDESLELEYESIDLKTAVIYKEILERKYFSI